MTDILKIAEKSIPMLDEMELDFNVFYRVEMVVKRYPDGTYLLPSITLGHADFSKPLDHG